jgi:hypothetical protein
MHSFFKRKAISIVSSEKMGGEEKAHSIKTSNEFYERAVFYRSQMKGSSLHFYTHILMLLLWNEWTLKW